MIEYFCPHCGTKVKKVIKKANKPVIGHTELLRLIRYDPLTGLFYRKIDGPSVMAGRRADKHKGNGYRTVALNGKIYQAQRLAWFYQYGIWSNGDMDHINGDPSDNRISNLRDITHSENIMNQNKRNKELRGTSFHKKGKRWTAQIGVDGRHIYLGMFVNREDAQEAYRKAVKKYFGHLEGV